MELMTKHACLECNFYTIVCTETFKCLMCCTAQNHGHCKYQECDNIDMCEENLLCNAHCISINHSHCLEYRCGNKEMCLENTEHQCILHCHVWDPCRCGFGNCTHDRDNNHNHCNEYLCDSRVLCKENSEKIRCMKHCRDSNHSHCSNPYCDSQDLHITSMRYSKNICNFCKKNNINY